MNSNSCASNEHMTSKKNLYNQSFYDSQASGSLRSAREVVPIIIDYIKPKSVVDVGCGVGAWLSIFREFEEVEHILGIDSHTVDTQNLLISKKNFVNFDLSQPLLVDRRFDLAMSLEVAEHIPEAHADTFITSLVNLSPVVLFSGAVPGQSGIGHVNEQWQNYWQKKFEKHGYITLDLIRSKVWDNPNVKYWYAQNTLLYVEETYFHNHLKTAISESPTSIIHPTQYLKFADPKQIDLRQIGLKRILIEIPWLVKNSISDRIAKLLTPKD